MVLDVPLASTHGEVDRFLLGDWENVGPPIVERTLDDQRIALTNLQVSELRARVALPGSLCRQRSALDRSSIVVWICNKRENGEVSGVRK